jgi:hypothetical protein
MNNRKYISIYFNAFAKRVENDILMEAFSDNLFDFYLHVDIVDIPQNL